MREQTREREEHANGRSRRADGQGPPRRPAHYAALRPSKRPRGRVATGFARVIGLLATAVLLAVGVTVVLMVTRDNGTDPPETFAQPNPTAAPKKQAARTKKKELTPAQRASRDAAVKQLRGQGFEPVSLADYKTGQSLRVLIGKPKASTGTRGRRAFFFVRRDYLGTDAASPSLRVRVLRQRDGVITLGYKLYLAGDKPSNPSGELAKVRFTISDGRLIPQDQIPPSSSRLPPS
jgi:hypothetical protein